MRAGLLQDFFPRGCLHQRLLQPAFHGNTPRLQHTLTSPWYFLMSAVWLSVHVSSQGSQVQAKLREVSTPDFCCYTWLTDAEQTTMPHARKRRSSSNGKKVEFVGLPILSSDDSPQPEGSRIADGDAGDLAYEPPSVTSSCHSS